MFKAIGEIFAALFTVAHMVNRGASAASKVAIAADEEADGMLIALRQGRAARLASLLGEEPVPTKK